MKKLNRQTKFIFFLLALNVIAWLLPLLDSLEILDFHNYMPSAIPLSGILTINIITLNKPLSRDSKIVLIVFQALLALVLLANVIFALKIVELSKDAYVAFIAGSAIFSMVACGYAYYFVRYPVREDHKGSSDNEQSTGE